MLDLVVDNGQVAKAHTSLVPSLHAISDMIARQIRSGRKKEAINVVRQQHFPPMALSFVARCLMHNGIPDKTIESVLLADLQRYPR